MVYESRQGVASTLAILVAPCLSSYSPTSIQSIWTRWSIRCQVVKPSLLGAHVKLGKGRAGTESAGRGARRRSNLQTSPSLLNPPQQSHTTRTDHVKRLVLSYFLDTSFHFTLSLPFLSLSFLFPVPSSINSSTSFHHTDPQRECYFGKFNNKSEPPDYNL